MKAQPIKFRETYSDFHIGDDVQEGFTSIRNDKENIIGMYVDMSFLEWKYGAYIHFEILEDVYPKTIVENGKISWKNNFERKVYYLNVFDNPTNANDCVIKPTTNQSLLINAIYQGQLRGNFAERIANTLYVNLFVLHPKSDFGKYLPEVKKFYENLVANNLWI